MPGEGVVGLLFRGVNHFTDAPIDLLCHLLSGVAEQPTCMRSHCIHHQPEGRLLQQIDPCRKQPPTPPALHAAEGKERKFGSQAGQRFVCSDGTRP